MPLYVSSTCAHHQEVKIALHSLWYHWYHHTYRCDDTRGCVMQFWPPDDEHMCSKHVEALNKLIVKQNVCASSWLIPEINTSCSILPFFKLDNINYYIVSFMDSRIYLWQWSIEWTVKWAGTSYFRNVNVWCMTELFMDKIKYISYKETHVI